MVSHKKFPGTGGTGVLHNAVLREEIFGQRTPH
jgi:hypothetical protein